MYLMRKWDASIDHNTGLTMESLSVMEQTENLDVLHLKYKALMD